MSAIWVWLQQNEVLLWWLGVGSVVTFVASLILVPILVARMSADYFAPERDGHDHFADRHPVVRAVLIGAKNILGVTFLVAGIAMLVLPGQGLLTMLIGVTLMDFPGKRGLERRIVGYPPLLRVINWMRVRSGKGRLKLNAEPAPDESHDA